MISDSRKILNFFSVKRIIFPVVIGLAGVLYLLWSSLDLDSIQQMNWGDSAIFWMLIAVFMMVIRDFAYMYRIRILTNNQISWRNSFDVIMLWEFASAITPSVVGGAGIAIFIINKEKISLGRSTALVMTTAFLDELFYVIMVPAVILLAGIENIFPNDSGGSFFGWLLSIQSLFLVGYGFILLLTSVMLYATFFNPQGIKNLMVKICRLGVLKRWRKSAEQTGDDLIVTSRDLKDKPFIFWIKAFGATFFAWTARFWVVNFIILAFSQSNSISHFGIYARQLIMWVVMLISPTPGSSGVAEVLFPQFLGEFISGAPSEVLGVIWRVLGYWPYLLIGVIVLPKWIQRVFLKRKLIKFKSQ